MSSFLFIVAPALLVTIIVAFIVSFFDDESHEEQ